jgi:hypothetical protein
MPPRKTAKVPENLLIVVHYTGPNGTLTEEEKKRFIKNLKKEHYYHVYLSGKFRFTFADRDDGCTEGRFIWKEGWHTGEANERVIALLLGDFNVLPPGVKVGLVEATMV